MTPRLASRPPTERRDAQCINCTHSFKAGEGYFYYGQSGSDLERVGPFCARCFDLIQEHKKPT